MDKTENYTKKHSNYYYFKGGFVMEICKIVCNSNKVNSDELLIKIEKMRNELNKIVDKNERIDSKVISKSQELDELINEYLKYDGKKA